MFAIIARLLSAIPGWGKLVGFIAALGAGVAAYKAVKKSGADEKVAEQTEEILHDVAEATGAQKVVDELDPGAALQRLRDEYASPHKE
jgi:hypothetical protein